MSIMSNQNNLSLKSQIDMLSLASYQYYRQYQYIDLILKIAVCSKFVRGIRFDMIFGII